MLPEPTRRQLNQGNDTTLVAGLRQLREEVFEVLEYDTVVVLDTRWATTVEFVVFATTNLWFDRPEEGFPRPRPTHPEPLTAEQPSMQTA